MRKSRLLLAFVALMLFSSSVIPVAFAQTEDTVAPEFQINNTVFIYQQLSVENAENMIRKQIKAVDNVDGDVSQQITFNIPSDYADRDFFTMQLAVKDVKGNRNTKYITVRVVEGITFFEGLKPIKLQAGEEANLVKGVKAYDEQFQEIPFEITDIKQIDATKMFNQYKLELLNNQTVKASASEQIEGTIYEVTYKSVDATGKERFATRIIDTSVEEHDPALITLTKSKQFVAPGETISFSADAYGDVELIDRIHISFTGGSGYANLSITLYFNEVSGKFEGKVKIPETYENKRWDFKYSAIYLSTGRSLTNTNTSYLKNPFITVFNGVDQEAPDFKGSVKYKTVSFTNEPYNVMDGIYVYDLIDGDLTSNVQVTNIPDFSKIGSYTVTYTVKDKAGNESSFERIYSVVDTINPKLTVKSSELEGYVEQGIEELTKMILANVTATDNYDGDISDKVTFTTNRSLTQAGSMAVNYEVQDSSRRKATGSARLILKNYPNYFNESGFKDITVIVNQPEDLHNSFNVSDGLGNILTPVEVIGEVDFSKVGVYKVVNKYKNKVGQTHEVERTITVIEKTPPWFMHMSTLTTKVGVPVDPLEGVKAFDMFGQDANFYGSGSIDFNKPGTYTYTITAYDMYSQSTQAVRTIIVEDDFVPFYDVPVGHLFYKEISRLKRDKIINGYPGNLYGPKDEIKRGQVAALIYRSGIPLNPIRAKKDFKDVTTANPFYTEIQALYQAGIIDGNGENFNPNDTLTREQLAKILVIAFSLKDLGGYENMFKDVAKNRWSYDYIINLASNKVTVGYLGNFSPTDPVTREQYAAFMYRALGY